MAIGIAVGTGLGVALHSIPVGAGAALGGLLTALERRRSGNP